MTTGVFESSVFKPTVFKTNYVPPVPNNFDTFDTHDGFTKEEYDAFISRNKRLDKEQSDKRLAKKVNKSGRLQSIKDLLEPKVIEPIKEVITPEVKEVVIPEVKKPVKVVAPVIKAPVINYAKRRELLDQIADRRYTLSLMKIVHGLDDYEIDANEYDESYHEDDLTKTLEILNQNYQALKDNL